MARAPTKPNLREPCYDCGSTIAGHHTTKCDLAYGERDVKDLGCIDTTQYWDRVVPEGLEITP